MKRIWKGMNYPPVNTWLIISGTSVNAWTLGNQMIIFPKCRFTKCMVFTWWTRWIKMTGLSLSFSYQSTNDSSEVKIVSPKSGIKIQKCPGYSWKVRNILVRLLDSSGISIRKDMTCQLQERGIKAWSLRPTSSNSSWTLRNTLVNILVLEGWTICYCHLFHESTVCLGQMVHES